MTAPVDLEEVDEVECVDCGSDISKDPDKPDDAQRCDTDEAHYYEDCGEDCPVICETCKEHHFGTCEDA